MKTPIDALHEDFEGVLACLEKNPSLQVRASDNFRRFLLVAAASYFEVCLSGAVKGFAAQVTSENHVLAHLVRNKAVERQYHSWFSWKEKTANNFFKLFGADFLAHTKKVQSEGREGEDIKKAIEAFMEIGRDRNSLAHEGIVGCPFEKTSDEVYATYKRALPFVEWFPVALAEFAKKQSPPPAEE